MVHGSKSGRSHQLDVTMIDCPPPDIALSRKDPGAIDPAGARIGKGTEQSNWDVEISVWRRFASNGNP